MNDKIMVKRDIVIIGGGPAGLAAALAAKKEGAESILILERDKELGGILNQCFHNGFGLHTFQEELTGPEYAARFIRMVKEQQIEYRLNTMVMDISQDKVITAMSRQEGMYQIQAKAVILAMGCRERPRGALNIPGYRPAGIYSAGTAQRLVNMAKLQRDTKVIQALHDISLQASGIWHQLCHSLNLRTFQSHTSGHDQSDITGSQDHYFFSRHKSFHIYKALCCSC